MVRYRSGTTVKQVVVSIPRKMLEDLDLRLLDPLTNQLMYGGRSAIIRKLIAAYLKGEIKLDLSKETRDE